MKLKDLIFNREKLRKYDELKEWRDKLESSTFADKGIMFMFECTSPHHLKGEYRKFPDHIQDIFVSALDAEIKKLDEECV